MSSEEQLKQFWLKHNLIDVLSDEALTAELDRLNRANDKYKLKAQVAELLEQHQTIWSKYNFDVNKISRTDRTIIDELNIEIGHLSNELSIDYICLDCDLTYETTEPETQVICIFCDKEMLLDTEQLREDLKLFPLADELEF